MPPINQYSTNKESPINMCGITGFLSPNTANREDVIHQMTSSLSHRGPDYQGIWRDDTISLGHARLSILDLRSEGNQPMCSNNKMSCIVFNGEIYNFLSIKKKYSPNSFYKSNTDTETLLHLWDSKKDRDFFNELNGMFALAIWDSNDKSLTLGRDRLGQKPLYYYWDESTFAFSSELNSLLMHPNIKKEADETALQLFWQYGYIPPPFSAYKNIYKLRAGSYIKLKNGNLTESKYWKIKPKNLITREKDALNTLDDLLKDAVQSRMQSDVPLGSFLSGGLDSSLITHYMTKASKNKINTYSIGFHEKSFDESTYAKEVSDYLKTEHHLLKIDCSPEELIEVMTRHFGEPFGDSSAIPYYYLSKFTKSDLTVALSGDGADELFGGYNRYKARRMMKAYHLIPSWIRKSIVDGLLLRFTKESTDYYQHNLLKKISSFQQRSNQISKDPLNFSPNIFSKDEVKELIPLFSELPSDMQNPIQEIIKNFKGLDPINQMIWTDVFTYLEGDINVKVDRMSMAHSLEVRSPFLDHNIVEFAATLPSDLKLKNLTTKYLLKKLSERYLPKSIIYRKKQGFGIPIGKWFKNDLKNSFEKMVLNNKNLPLNHAYIKNLFDNHQSAKQDNGIQMWHLLIYSSWFTNAKL